MQVNATDNSGNSILAAGNPKPTTNSSTDSLANKDVFLQLMVEQIKNQDPLNPTDGTQFLSQLAQFTQVEQLTQIRAGIDKLNTAATTPIGATDPAASGAANTDTTTKKTGN